MNVPRQACRIRTIQREHVEPQVGPVVRDGACKQVAGQAHKAAIHAPGVGQRACMRAAGMGQGSEPMHLVMQEGPAAAEGAWKSAPPCADIVWGSVRCMYVCVRVLGFMYDRQVRLSDIRPTATIHGTCDEALCSMRSRAGRLLNMSHNDKQSYALHACMQVGRLEVRLWPVLTCEEVV